MTIDDRLRDYATRWNAAAPPSPAVRPVSDPAATAGPLAPGAGPRHRRSPRLAVAAVVAVLLLGAASVTGGVLVQRHGDSNAPVHTTDSSPYPPGVVDTATPDGTVIPVAQRVAAADVGGPLLTGGPWSLTSHRDEVVVVAAWGSWCQPCRDYAPSLDDLVGPGVSVVGFAVHDTALLDRFVDAQGIRYPVVTDPDGAVLTALGAQPQGGEAVPATFLVDRHGGIAAAYLGPVPRTDLHAAVDQLLAE